MPTTSPLRPLSATLVSGNTGMFMMLSLWLGERTPAPQQRQSVLSDHQLFVGRNDIDRRGFGTRDHECMAAVLDGIERNPQPADTLGDACADKFRIFANTCGEDQGVNTLQGGSEHSDTQRRAVNEVVDGKRRYWILACLQLAHVVADAGKALQSAIAIKEILYRGRRHALDCDKIQDHARIDLPGPSSHRQTIEGRESHGALHAAPGTESAHRCTAAEMGNNDPAHRNVGR